MNDFAGASQMMTFNLTWIITSLIFKSVLRMSFASSNDLKNIDIVRFWITMINTYNEWFGIKICNYNT